MLIEQFFVIFVDIHNIFWLVLLTFLPALELRASIPVGLWSRPLVVPFFGTVNGLGLSLLEVLPIVLVANVLLGIFLFFFLDSLVRTFTKIHFINVIYSRIVEKTQKKVEKYVDKWGTLGLALFIAVPLPGSGVWTGALAAHLLGMKFKKFLVAEIIGVLIAGTLVTLATVGLLGGLL